MDNLHIVRLDMEKFPQDDRHPSALLIVNALFRICGLDHSWTEPRHKYNLHFVREIPQDIPQAGIYWIEVSEEEAGIVRCPEDQPFPDKETP